MTDKIDQSLTALLNRAMARYDSMTPEQKKIEHEIARLTFVRGEMILSDSERNSYVEERASGTGKRPELSRERIEAINKVVADLDDQIMKLQQAAVAAAQEAAKKQLEEINKGLPASAMRLLQECPFLRLAANDILAPAEREAVESMLHEARRQWQTIPNLDKERMVGLGGWVFAGGRWRQV